MKPKKSQVTMFIFTGIVLLIVVGFVFYIVSYTIKKQTQKEVKTKQKQDVKLIPIETYITACLESSAKKALKLVGEQGGIIFTDQGGLTERTELVEDVDYVVRGNSSIWMGIREPITATCNGGDGCLYGCSDDPDCITGADCGEDNFCVIGCSSADIDCGKKQFSTCNGGDGCSGGCYYDLDCGNISCNAGDGCMAGCSPEDIDCAGFSCPKSMTNTDGMCVVGCSILDIDCGGDRGITITEPDYPWRCFPYNMSCTSIYDDMPSTGYFGRNILIPLTGVGSVQNQLEFFITNDVKNCINLSTFEERGYDIQKGMLSADVGLAGRDTSVTLNYPLNLKNVKTGEKILLNSFSYKSKVNLRGIYSYLNETINQDIRNITFSPDNKTKDQFRISVAYGGYDIISVNDTTAVIDGKQYSFKIARVNRMPALKYLVGEIDPAELTLDDYAYDPDEDCPDSCSISPDVPNRNVTLTDGSLTDYQEEIYFAEP